jgi:hypothetical protein
MPLAPNPFPTPKLIMEPPRSVYSKNWAYLKRERDQWLRTWEDLADYVLPYLGMRYEYETSYADRRPKRSKRIPVIINNKASMAARVLINGLAAGLTSPSRPWLRLGVPQDTSEPDYEAKRWLFGASRAILWLCSTSNYYTATKLQYRDLIVFGPGVKIIDEHAEHDVNCINAPVGSYCLGLGEDGRPNTLYREVLYRAEHLIARFGYERCSKEVRRAYDQGNYYKEFKVCHVIEPNRLFQKGQFGPKGMRYASVYYEQSCGEDETALLGYKGYNEKCFSGPRWDFLPGDTYGPSAAMETLGDIKALQVLEHRKAQAVDKQVTPPTQGPPSLSKARIGHMPGSHTTVSEVSQKITSLYDVRPDMLAISQEIQRHEARIDEAFYVDIMRSATDLTRQNVKAEEILERREEKMMMFSPLLENLYTELLDVDVQRLLAIGMRIGLIPPPPPSLRERDLKIEYISTLAQAQKASSIGSIERVFTFAGSLAGAYPEVKDKIDADAAIDEYADAVGAPASILVPDQAVQQLRQMRQQQAQQEQAVQQTAVGVEAAKNLSEAQLTDPSMLQYLIGGAGS